MKDLANNTTQMCSNNMKPQDIVQLSSCMEVLYHESQSDKN